ncbi:hypothetical protein MAR_031224 [Mya arenaria]|uniref:Uncharacterized protein n=1 Tax=Mya arenaria TaxID=6604 RepID=A0ABY7F4E7_MYAAR|nr:hypothetical protein MAR_031224 [Mya arenaria]
MLKQASVLKVAMIGTGVKTATIYAILLANPVCKRMEHVHATSTPKSDSSFGGLLGGTVCGANTIVSVVIVTVVFLYMKRRKLHKKPPESGTQRAFRNPNPLTIEDQEMHYQQLSDRHNTTVGVQQLSDRHNTTSGVQDEAYTELQTNNMDYELLDI